MANATIETIITGKPTIIGSSREDLDVGDTVLLDSVYAGTAYSWSVAYKPEGSTVTFSGSPVNKSPGTITLDKEGSYLIQLVFTDGTGITEQTLRLRVLTAFGALRLVAAGETVGPTPIPSDITATGWADTQNYNIQKLLDLVRSAQSSAIFRRLDYDHTSTTPTVIATLEQDECLVKVFFNNTVSFNSVSPTISIGDNTNVNRFVSASDVDLHVTSKYELLTMDTVSTTTNIIYYPTLGGASTGSGYILALIQKV